MANILWVIRYQWDFDVIESLLESVRREGHSIHEAAWYGRTGLAIDSLVSECRIHKCKVVVLHWPEINKVLVKDTIRRFQMLGAKVLVLDNGFWGEESCEENAREDFPVDPGVLLREIATLLALG